MRCTAATGGILENGLLIELDIFDVRILLLHGSFLSDEINQEY